MSNSSDKPCVKKYSVLLLILPLFLVLVRCANDGLAPGSFITFAFLSNYGSNTISVFKLNTTTGALTDVPGSPFVNTGGTAAAGLAVHPNGKFLYVANDAGNSISGYSINATTGALTTINGSPFSGVGCTGNAVPVIDPSGRFLYVQNYAAGAGTNICGFTINTTTGALTSVGPAVVANSQPFGGIFHPNGHFYYVSNTGSFDISIFSINQTTGVAANLSNFSLAGDAAVTFTIDKTGKFLIAPLSIAGTYNSYPVDSVSGALSAAVSTVLSTGGAASSASCTTVHPNNRFVYGGEYGTSTLTAMTFNSTTGALALIPGSATASGAGTRSISIDPTGRFLYAMNESVPNITAYSINQSTGALTTLSFSPITSVGTTPQQLIFYQMPQPRP